MTVIKVPANADMVAIAADWDRSASARQNRSEQLAAEGHTVAADTHSRGAREAREHATAARQGREAYEDYLNGW